MKTIIINLYDHATKLVVHRKKDEVVGVITTYNSDDI